LEFKSFISKKTEWEILRSDTYFKSKVLYNEKFVEENILPILRNNPNQLID